MGKDWTDAEFEVVGNHYRPGERNRDPKLKRWIFTGRVDAHGHPLWYRPPRLNRFWFAIALLLASPVVLAAIIGLVWSVQRLRSYWLG